MNNAILRIAGIILFFAGVFVTKISIIEQWTIISADNKITSQDFMAFIEFLRAVLILLGFLLIVYPQSIKCIKQLIITFEKKYDKIKMNLPPLLFVIILCLLFLSYLALIFIGQFHTVSTRSQIEDSERIGLLADLLNTGIYFQNTFVSALFSTEVDVNKIDLPIYKLYIKEELIDTLNANLPESGLEFVEGSLVLNNTIYKTKFRYRGDTYHHWHFKKKSWRIKLKDKGIINYANKFNIVNPKLDSHIDMLLVNKIAEKFGLINPRIFPITLLINNEYEGVYYYVDQIDELFIRMREKLPGDIFYGELFGDFTRRGTLFDNASNWDIMATADNDIERARENINLLISSVTQEDNVEFYYFFNKHLGEDYLKFYALTALLDENRVDDSHNHKLYFNPSNGMFEPIVWDIMPFLNNNVPLNNEQSNALFTKINQIPFYVEKKNQLLKQYLDEMPEESLFEYIDNTSSRIEYEIKHDKFKDAYKIPWVLTYKKWKESIINLKKAIRERYSFLRQQLDNTTVTLSIINSTDRTFLVFDIVGESGIKINNFKLQKKTTVNEQCHVVFKDTNFNNEPDDTEKIYNGCGNTVVGLNNEQLYPGKEHSLRYVYLVKSNPSNELKNISVILSNSVTGRKVTPIIRMLPSLEMLEKLPQSSSLHPWKLPLHENKTITLEGETTLTNNLIIDKNDLLIIKPGTTIKLAKDVSIISYGKIVADGTPAQVISFVPSSNKPWGGIILQGQNSNNSVFNNCVIDGGSGAKHALVKYTGMLSAYNTEITINNCHLKNNKKEDDAFNAKNSRVQITNTTFTNTFSDAIDFDFTTGTIENNKFNNINGDAIDLMTSHVVIKNNQITNTGDKGISVGEKSNPTITNNTITKSNIGIAIKDQSNAAIINNKITNNKIGIAAYQKNWQYGGGGFGTIKNTNLCKNTQPISIQNKSEVQIEVEGKNILCTEEVCGIQCQ